MRKHTFWLSLLATSSNPFLLPIIVLPVDILWEINTSFYASLVVATQHLDIVEKELDYVITSCDVIFSFWRLKQSIFNKLCSQSPRSVKNKKGPEWVGSRRSSIFSNLFCSSVNHHGGENGQRSRQKVRYASSCNPQGTRTSSWLYPSTPLIALTGYRVCPISHFTWKGSSKGSAKDWRKGQGYQGDDMSIEKSFVWRHHSDCCFNHQPRWKDKRFECQKCLQKKCKFL